MDGLRRENGECEWDEMAVGKVPSSPVVVVVVPSAAAVVVVFCCDVCS